ncbi:MAG: cysteine hydrolase [Anaerolineae bacterium]|nr:cysteine hydrolase [Anaerolineae bacterium]
MTVDFVPTGTVDVPDIAYEERIELPATRTGLIVVDMQNDFVKPEGGLSVPAATEVVQNIQRLLAMARLHRVRIIYTQDTQLPDDPEFDIWPKHCVMGTWSWEIIEALSPHPEDLICRKNRYDAFYGSWLNHFLSQVWDIEHLVLVGAVPNICVLHTAASAGLRWYRVVVPADGIAALTTFGQALTLHQVSSLYNGDVVRSVDHLHFEVAG